MNYSSVLITGGAGFVGSNLAVLLKETYPSLRVVALDNLSRRGSELNLGRLKKHGIEFYWGDVRMESDINVQADLLIECSAEPSVMAGVDNSPAYLVNSNLQGAYNCFEYARKNRSDIIFLSTSRVYPVVELNNISFIENETRYDISGKNGTGVSKQGISEDFPLGKVRTMYGATKLSAEFLLAEYINNYNIRGVINRCGVISGPWQMGKIDQGVITLWMAAHFFKKNLSYIGFEGSGKQVRDVLHVNDLFQLINIEMNQMKQMNGEILNVGGGANNSVSLLELTKMCKEISGNEVVIKKLKKDRPGDVRIYITDNSKVSKMTLWKPRVNIRETLVDVYDWIAENQHDLREVFY